MEQINSILQYLTFLERYSDYKEKYYRGQSEKYQTMPPSIVRDNGYLENESSIFNESISLKPEEFKELTTPIQKLSKLQHNGIPTRLVDLSIDPLVSLYFAVEDVNSKYPGNVYVYIKNGHNFDDINVRILSILATLPNNNLDLLKYEYKKTFNQDITDEQILKSVNEPIFIKHCEELKKTNIRLFNQKGTFAICGNEVVDNVITKKVKSIDTIIPTIVIRIPYEYKIEIKRELDEKYAINRVHIYPELPSVADYIKAKYKESNFDPHGKYSIVKTEDVSHPMAKRTSLTLVLSELLNIDEIKRVAIKVIEKHKDDNDVIWIYIAKNGDDYIMTNWIIQGQWINPHLDKRYRPLQLSEFDDNGYYWQENSSYSVLSDYYSENIFKDDKELFICNQKIYEELKPILSTLHLVIQKEFSIDKVKDIINNNKKKINRAYMQLGDLGHSRNKSLDDFLSNYIQAISPIDNIHYWLENKNINEKGLKYEISKCIKDAEKSFYKIEQESKNWYKELNINDEDYNSIDPYDLPKKEYQYIQTLSISPNALSVDFNVKANINQDNTFTIIGTTNLFDGGNLMISIYNQLDNITGSSNATILNSKFKSETFSMLGHGYQPGIYKACIILPIPSVQSKDFTNLAGIEYENLTGEYVDRTGIGPIVNYNFNFTIY